MGEIGRDAPSWIIEISIRLFKPCLS